MANGCWLIANGISLEEKSDQFGIHLKLVASLYFSFVRYTVEPLHRLQEHTLQLGDLLHLQDCQ